MKLHTRIALVAGCSLLLGSGLFAKDADKKFKQMDTNGDGAITRQEHAAGAQEMFTKMDANHDGIVTVAELDTKMDKKDGKTDRHELSASEKIKIIDGNGDGQVTAAEHAAASEVMFERMDTNRDGSLSEKECEAGHKQMEKEHKKTE